MVEEQITGKVVDIDADGTLTIKAGVPSIDRALLRQYKDCLIVLDDGRHISPVQRRKIYALIGEIDEYVNGTARRPAWKNRKPSSRWNSCSSA